METMPATQSNEVQAVEHQAPISVEDVKKYIAPNASEKELFFFMGLCQTYGLNPLKKEIYFVKYGNQAGSIVVGYETYIKRAERSGRLDGWEVELGKDEIGQKATITIHRKDRSHPFVWTVYRTEFDSGKANWAKMPLFMLRKVAISQGFRLAFPEEMGGMPYIPEEINGTVSEDLKNVAETPNANPEETITPDQNKKLHAVANDLGLDRDALLKGCSAHCGRVVSSTRDMTKSEASTVIDAMERKLNAA